MRWCGAKQFDVSICTGSASAFYRCLKRTSRCLSKCACKSGSPGRGDEG